MNNQRLPRLLTEIAEQGIPTSPDRASDILRCYKGSQTRRAFLKGMRQPALAGILLALLLIVMVVPIALPTVSAAVGSIVRQSGVVLVKPTAPTSSSAQRTPAAIVIGATFSPPMRLSLHDAQQQASFHISVPSRLPPGIVFQKAVMSPDDADRVDLFFGQPGSQQANVHIAEARGQSSGGYGFPSDQAQAVMINRYPALYFRGSWRLNETWDNLADVGTVAWESDNVSYMVQVSHLGISEEELIRLAESLY